jgi:hypothetical protein
VSGLPASGSALWAFLWLGGPFEVSDTVPIGLFALCIGAVSLFAISGRSILGSASGSLLNPMGMTDSLKIGSIGGVAAALVLAALVVKSGHSGLALTLFFIGMAGMPPSVQTGRHGCAAAAAGAVANAGHGKAPRSSGRGDANPISADARRRHGFHHTGPCRCFQNHRP